MWDAITFLVDFFANGIKSIISIFTSIVGGQTQLIRMTKLFTPDFIKPILDVILVLLPLFFILNFIRRFI